MGELTYILVLVVVLLLATRAFGSCCRANKYLEIFSRVAKFESKVGSRRTTEIGNLVVLDIFLVALILKERPRPWVSNVTSADVRLATGIGTATSLVNVTNSI